MFTPSVLYQDLAKSATKGLSGAGHIGAMQPFAMRSMQPPFITGQVQHVEGPSFKDTMSGLMHNLNDVVRKPDSLLQDALTTGHTDIHQVMIANAKAELAVNITAQFTTKMVQAYDRITQIQV